MIETGPRPRAFAFHRAQSAAPIRLFERDGRTGQRVRGEELAGALRVPKAPLP